MLPELYHAHHSLHREDIPFWLALASQAGGPLLELGCGTGRVLIPLAQAGFTCTGLDRDLSMLRYLQASLPPNLAISAQLLLADMSRFALASQFSLVILPCNTFSTLPADQRRSCLACVRRHLSPAGLFALSLPNPEVIERLPARSEPELEEEFILPRTGNPVQVSSAWRRTRHTFTVTWVYDQLFPDGSVERLTLQSVHQLFPTQGYLDEIQAAGLRILDLYGDFERSPYTTTSPNLVIVAAA